MAKPAGTARRWPGYEACRVQIDRRAATADTAREPVSRAGPARWYDPSKYIVEFSKKCIVVGA
jgi:hypothetical protein